jgi:hypothetical protein
MRHYTIFFITVNVLHVSGRFSAHHQELKNCTHNIGYMPSLLAATTSMSKLELTHSNSPMLAVAESKLGLYLMLGVQFLSS